MSQIEKSYFTTRQLPPDERIPAWRESISTVFDTSPCRGISGENFNSTVSSYLINDQLMVSHCETNAQHFERSPLKVARDNLDYFVIQTHLSGSQTIRQGARDGHCATGDLLVIDLLEQHHAETTDFMNLTLVVPRHLLAPHLLQPESQAGRVLKGNSALAAMAVNHLKSIYGIAGYFTKEESAQIIEPTILLLASALNGSIESVNNGLAGTAQGMLARAKLEIERNLRKNLNAERLCAVLGYSRSTLYRLFEPDGGVRAYIQERRLRRSAEDLLTDATGMKRICDIAYAWGFASEAHYSRVFRQRFGVTPSEARLNRFSMPAPTSSISGKLIGDRDYERWLAENLR